MLVFDELGLRPKAEVEELKNGIILDEEESIVFDMCVRHKSAQEIAFKIGVSPRTVFRIMSRLRIKILNYLSVL